MELANPKLRRDFFKFLKLGVAFDPEASDITSAQYTAHIMFLKGIKHPRQLWQTTSNSPLPVIQQSSSFSRLLKWTLSMREVHGPVKKLIPLDLPVEVQTLAVA